MKFNIQSKLLLSHLTAVSKVISNKNAYAILENFLFEIEGGKLVVTGCDMETRVTTTIEVPDAEGSGRFAVDMKRIINLLREMPDVGVTVDVNEESLEVTITYLNGEFNITAFNGEDYPMKALAKGEVQEFIVPEKDVYLGVSHTLFAVGNDEMHPQFMGVLWDIKADNITFVASDSHKLVRYTKGGLTPNIDRMFILPAKPASILASLLDKDSSDPVHVIVDDVTATFEVGAYSLTCQFINGRYPDYNRVIPSDNAYTLVVDRMTLLTAMRRVSIFASVGGLVKLDINADGVRLTASDLDHSTSAEERIQCEYNGEPLVMGFKNSDIIEVLNNIDAERVVIKLSDPSRAGVILPSDQNDGGELLVLQMPMMI